MAATVLYDADCGFCRWCTGVLLRWDRHRRLRPVALQSAEAQRLLTGMSEDRRMGSLHVVEEDGAIRSAGAALVALARLLPGAQPLAAAGARMPAVVERGYGAVAGHRGALGRLVSGGARRRADAVIARRRGA